MAASTAFSQQLKLVKKCAIDDDLATISTVGAKIAASSLARTLRARISGLEATVSPGHANLQTHKTEKAWQLPRFWPWYRRSRRTQWSI
jgi:hypothetical protein